MKRALSVALALSYCSGLLFCQVKDARPPAIQQKPTRDSVEILSEKMGVDFGPYLSQVLRRVRQNWLNLIPQVARAPNHQKGRVVIEFSILKDGRVTGMTMAPFPLGSTADAVLDRAAWESITVSDPFEPLPAEFVGTHITVRFHFYYNPDKDNGTNPAAGNLTTTPGDITINVFPSGPVRVRVGGSHVFVASVKGSTNAAVKWSVSGSGCSGSACGMISNGFYAAPTVLPNPPSVLLTATSEADPSASATVTVQLYSSSTK